MGRSFLTLHNSKEFLRDRYAKIRSKVVSQLSFKFMIELWGSTTCKKCALKKEEKYSVIVSLVA